MIKYVSSHNHLQDEIELLKRTDTYHQEQLSRIGRTAQENQYKVDFAHSSISTLETKVLALIILQALSLGLIILLFFLISYL